MPLFADEEGKPFKDGRFAAIIMGALTAVLGATRAKLYSPHSWRVWLATSLRMCGASDARIQAFGRPGKSVSNARCSKAGGEGRSELPSWETVIASNQKSSQKWALYKECQKEECIFLHDRVHGAPCRRLSSSGCCCCCQ